jgi:hypothetical protein
MNSKATSILSYFGVLWFVAFFAGTKDEKSVYHLKQGFGLMITSAIAYLVYEILLRISIPLALLMGFVFLFILVISIIGIVYAAKEEQKPLPLLGKMFEGFNFIK